MTKAVIVRVELTNEDDADWVRNRVVPVVETEVDEINESGRLDGTAEVSWEYED